LIDTRCPVVRLSPPANTAAEAAEATDFAVKNPVASLMTLMVNRCSAPAPVLSD
jgi:hypothetical protein